MPAKTNTPAALGGTNNSPDEPESNRAAQDLAMAHTRRPSHTRSASPAPPSPFPPNLEPAPGKKPGPRSGFRPGGAATRERRAAQGEYQDELSETSREKPPASDAALTLSLRWPQGWPGGEGRVRGADQTIRGSAHLAPCSTRGGDGQPAGGRDRTREIPPREILFLDPGVTTPVIPAKPVPGPDPGAGTQNLPLARTGGLPLVGTGGPSVQAVSRDARLRGGDGQPAGERDRTREVPAREIVFIDPGVSDIATLLGHLRPEVEAILLDPVRPAASQMAAALAGHHGLDSVHVIAHGAPGHVNFTAGDWSAATLEEEAEDLAAIGQALGGGGNLNLWSCQTAAGPAGAAFIAGLARASGADIAAATGRVGAAALGGGWELKGAAQPPMTGRGLQVYAGLLAGVYRIISGDVPHDPAENVTYVVVNSKDKRVVASFSLPGRANIPKFSITVTVPSGSETYEAGRLDERGNFIPANFTVSETSPFSTGPMNAGEPRHGA
jgi:hypothetical protein